MEGVEGGMSEDGNIYMYKKNSLYKIFTIIHVSYKLSPPLPRSPKLYGKLRKEKLEMILVPPRHLSEISAKG